jgi:hypothetical protein
MSKNNDRYKEDWNVDIEELDELDINKFEQIHTKKEKSHKKGTRKQQPELEELSD